MAVFGVLTEFNPTLKEFMDKTINRFSDSNLIKNPFTVAIKKYTVKEEIGDYKKVNPMYVIHMQPIYFNYPIYIWFLVLLSYIVSGWQWWLIPMIGLGSFGFFWSSYFFFFMFKLGAKKAGYRGMFSYVRPSTIVKGVVFR